AASHDLAIEIGDDVIRQRFCQPAMRARQHDALCRIMRNHANDGVDVCVCRRPNIHAAPPKIVRPTRTRPTPPSIAAFTAFNFGIMPPLTKLAANSSFGLFERSITVHAPSLTPSTSVKNSNSLHSSATATAAAVSSPLTLSSESSPSANVGTTGILPRSRIAFNEVASARTFAPTKPHGPDFFCAPTTPNMPTAGNP